MVLFSTIFFFFLSIFNLQAQEINDLAPCGNKLFAATDQGIYEISNNGGKVSKSTSAVSGDYDKIVSSGSSLLSSKYDKLFWLSLDSGKTWNPVVNLPKEIYQIGVSGKTIFINNKKGMWLTRDYGKNWEFQKKFKNVAYLARTNIAGKFFFANMDPFEILCTEDEGLNWTPLGPFYYALNVLCLEGEKLYAGCALRVEASNDNGKSWETIIKGVGKYLGVIENNICVAGGNADEKGIRFSHDKGKTWNKVEADKTVKAITSIGNNFYAVLNKKLYKSSDFGDTWALVPMKE